MEACDINVLINKTQELLHNGMIDNGGLTPALATVEIQKLKGDDGRLYKLCVTVEPYDPATERKMTPYLGDD
jgi:hypothetical protein